MTAPTISVVIPNYNHAPYLAQRIESVLSQTYPDFEVIILDDCSTDDSRSIIERYAQQDERIRTMFNNTNSGSPFAQWNKGVGLAHGEFIWIAESDDYAAPQLLETLVDPLKNDRNVGLAYCQSTIVDESGRAIGTAKSWTDDLDEERWKTTYTNQGADECRYLLYKNTIPNASAVLFRKAVFWQAGGGDPALRTAGDWLVWMKMLMHTDIFFTPTPLNYFRNHPHTTRYTPEPKKIINKTREEYQVVSFGLQQIPLSVHEREKTLQAVFNRLISLFPIRLLLSSHFVDFVRIARSVDPGVSRKIVHYLPKVVKRIRQRALSAN
jgi:glycosyltransferase involved in cell wall biosynthesis